MRVAGGVARCRRSSAVATTAIAAGTTSQASRQLTSPRIPTSGMPTIHASGGPSSVRASTRDLFAAVDHSAVAAIAAEYDTPIPTPTSACATTSTAKFGAAPLTSEPIASIDERAEHETAQSHTRRQQPRRERGGTGGETGHRP